MIHNDEQLAVVRRQLARAEDALADLRRDVFPKNPRNFAIFAEAYVDQILALRADVDAYLGIVAGPPVQQLPAASPVSPTGGRLG